MHKFSGSCFALALLAGFASLFASSCKSDRKLSPVLHMTLELDGRAFLTKLAGKEVDAAFHEAINHAVAKKKSEEIPWVDAFVDSFELQGADSLAHYFVGKNRGLNRNAGKGEVWTWLDDQFRDVFDRNVTIIRSRLDQFGVTQPTLQADRDYQLLKIELPGEVDQSRVERLVTSSSEVEFWKAKSLAEGVPVLARINRQCALIDSLEPYIPVDSGYPGPIEEERELILQSNHPFSSLFIREIEMYGEGVQWGYALPSDTAAIHRYLRHPEIKKIMGDDFFLWVTNTNEQGSTFLELICLDGNNGEGAPLDCSHVTEARQEFGNYDNRPLVMIKMDAEGADKWARLTRIQTGGYIAIVMDGVVLSVPRVLDEIQGGRTQISGNFSIEEAKDMANSIQSGSMPTRMTILSSEIRK